MRVSNIDVHQRGGVSTIDRFRALLGGDGNIAKTHRHEAQAHDTTVEKADSQTQSVDGGATIESASTTIEHSVGVSELEVIDVTETRDVRIESIQTTDIGHAGTTPTSAAGPRVDKQLRGSSSTSTLVVTSPNGLGRHEYHDGYYSKYSKYVFHFCHF